MARKGDYQRYLRSREWKRLRFLAIKRANNRCEMCDRPAENVHHVRYPKRFRDDHLDNLVVLCSAHHAVIHGIRSESVMRKDLSVFTFNDGLIETAVRTRQHNGEVLFHFGDVYKSMGGPVDDSPHLKHSKQNGTFESLITRSWRDIHEPFKVEVWEENKDGSRRPERYLRENGVFALGGRLNSPKARKFQEWLYGVVLPSIKEKGSYTHPGNSQTDIMRMVATQIHSMADKMDELDERKLDKGEFYNAMADIGETMPNQLRQRAATARQFIGETGVAKPSQQNAMKLGQEAKKIWRQEGKGKVPTIPEGTYHVHMWPIEILQKASKKLGWGTS